MTQNIDFIITAFIWHSPKIQYRIAMMGTVHCLEYIYNVQNNICITDHYHRPVQNPEMQIRHFVSYNLKRQTAESPEMWVPTYQTTQRYIPEDTKLNILYVFT
jgi:hypothetical protein